MCERPTDSFREEGHRSVGENTFVPLGDDIGEVVVVFSGLLVGAVETHVAESSSGFRQVVDVVDEYVEPRKSESFRNVVVECLGCRNEGDFHDCALSEVNEEVVKGIEDDGAHDSPDDQRPDVEEETDDFSDHRFPIMNLITQTAPVRRTALSRMMKKRMLRPQPTLIIL